MGIVYGTPVCIHITYICVCVDTCFTHRDVFTLNKFWYEISTSIETFLHCANLSNFKILMETALRGALFMHRLFTPYTFLSHC